MGRVLTPEEKAAAKKLIDSDRPLPVDFLPLLFPEGDGTHGEREKTFQNGITRLGGGSWTAFAQHDAERGPPPSSQTQIAWPWRREIWHVHFGCAAMLERAYRTYSSGWYGDPNGFNDISRILMRYSFLVGALALHNGLEDRIAQLANALLACPDDERNVYFKQTFASANAPTSPVALLGSWTKARQIRADADFQKIHKLANEVKHRWTGEFVPHLPNPQMVRDQLAKNKASYVQYGLAVATGSFLPTDWKLVMQCPHSDITEGLIWEQEQKASANIDTVCRLLQKSHNMLVDLALCLDTEIDWPKHRLRWAPQN